MKGHRKSFYNNLIENSLSWAWICRVIRTIEHVWSYCTQQNACFLQTYLLCWRAEFHFSAFPFHRWWCFHVWNRMMCFWAYVVLVFILYKYVQQFRRAPYIAVAAIVSRWMLKQICLLCWNPNNTPSKLRYPRRRRMGVKCPCAEYAVPKTLYNRSSTYNPSRITVKLVLTATVALSARIERLGKDGLL